MKAITNITGIIIFSLLTISGILWVTYKISDIIEGLKVNVEIDEIPDYVETKIKTVYPEQSFEKFNEWAGYIHNLNNRR